MDDLQVTIPPTIEEQVTELVEAGWKHRKGCIWVAPSGDWYLGPHGAWKVLRGMDSAGKVASRG